MNKEDIAIICAITFWSVVIVVCGWVFYKPLFIFAVLLVGSLMILGVGGSVFYLTQKFFLKLFDAMERRG